MREARLALSYAGMLSFLAALWLATGLSFCSVNPELSTSANHILGSMTHILSSSLLQGIGVMSFSIVLVLLRLGATLCSTSLPVISLRDCSFYLSFLLIAATHLQLALDQQMFGAPIGGRVGLFLSGLLNPLGGLGAQGICCSLLFALFFAHTRMNAHNSSSSGSEVDRSVSAIQLESVPVKSLNIQQQKVYTHIFEQVGELPPEFEEDQRRFEAVDSFYDDLDGGRQNSALQAEEAIEPVFSFEFEDELEEPRFTGLELALNQSQPRLTQEDTVPRDRRERKRSQERDLPHTHPSGSYPRERVTNQDTGPRQNSATFSRSGLGLVGMSAQLSRASTGHGHQEPNAEGRRARTELSRENIPLSVTLSPIDHLSQAVTPRVSREMILQKGFDTQGITLALTQTLSSKVSDHYLFVSPIPLPSSLYEVSDQLNKHIKRSLGRTEPALLLTSYPKAGKYVVCVTWPRRDRNFIETTEAMHVIRELERRRDLHLFLGEQSSGEHALLPMTQLKSLMITGGDQIDPDQGLNLILTNLIYQAPPDQLRLIICDEREHATLSQLPHLYSPIVHHPEQITDLLKWLPIEYRRRRTQMGRVGTYRFGEYQRLSEGDVRIVCLFPELSQLSDAQCELLTLALDKISQSSYEVGIHIVMNTRSAFTEKGIALAQIVDAHIALATDGFEQANRMLSPGAEWLLPQSDSLVRVGDEPPLRVHTWQLSHAGYHRILSVLANAASQEYINPSAEFLDPAGMGVRRRPSREMQPVDHDASKKKGVIVATIAGTSRPSEASLPPV